MWGVIASGAQMGMNYLSARKQKDVQEGAFRIKRLEDLNTIDDIEVERGRLTDQQRQVKATQRMSVASRGGMMGGTDLMTLANEAKEMQMDQLEMMRKKEAIRVQMENEAAMRDYQQNYTKNWLKKNLKVHTPFGKIGSEGYEGF